MLASRCCIPPPPQTRAPQAVTGVASTPFALRAQGDLPSRSTSVPGRQLRRQYVRERRGGGAALNHRVINMCGWGGDEGGGSAAMQTFTVGLSRPCKQQRRYKRGRLNNRWDVRGSGCEGYLGGHRFRPCGREAVALFLLTFVINAVFIAFSSTRSG